MARPEAGASCSRWEIRPLQPRLTRVRPRPHHAPPSPGAQSSRARQAGFLVFGFVGSGDVFSEGVPEA